MKVAVLPSIKYWATVASFAIFCLVLPSVAGADEPLHYTINATLDVPSKRITATQTVKFTNTSSQEIREVFFQFYPNRRYTVEEKKFMLRFGGSFKVNPRPEGFPKEKMKIYDVLVGERTADYSVAGDDETLLRVALSQVLPAGASV